jgi:hypothetical protein
MIGRYQQDERARESLPRRVRGDSDRRGDANAAAVGVVIGVRNRDQHVQVANGKKFARLGEQALGVIGLEDARFVQGLGLRDQAENAGDDFVELLVTHPEQAVGALGSAGTMV